MKRGQASPAACPCDSGLPLDACCGPRIAGFAPAPTALALMRSRYTAYVLHEAGYLLDTWHPDTRPATLAVETDRRWLGLRVLSTTEGAAGDETGTVEFVARFKIAGRASRLHESSRFVFEDGRWLYVTGDLR